MNLAHAHLLLNHLPIIGSLITLVLLAVAIVANQDHLKEVSLTLFSLIALMAIPTYISGSGAADAIKESPEISATMIETHQGAALLAFIFMEITGLASLTALLRFSRRGPWGSSAARLNMAAVLVFALATAGLMAVAGNTGGDIRHREIAPEETASAIGAMGVKLVAGLQYIVIDSSMWIWPLVEDLHFMGLILLFGVIGIINLRILGFMKQLPVAALKRFLPWGIAGFAINVVTGFLFYIGMPGFYVLNFVFQLKILTILVAGGMLLLFYCTSAFRSVEHLGPGEEASPMAKFIALSSIVLWILVIVLGRYIPFGEVT